MNRREFIKSSSSFVACATLSSFIFKDALFAEDNYDSYIASVIKGKTVVDGGKTIKLTIPDKPENGLKTSVEIFIDYPMNTKQYISRIHVLAPKNKLFHAMTADFSPKSGMAFLYTEMRVGIAQEVVVLAETNEGKIFKATKMVQVEPSGCGG
jgi:sulfur-oxidizing protein SoxY